MATSSYVLYLSLYIIALLARETMPGTVRGAVCVIIVPPPCYSNHHLSVLSSVEVTYDETIL